MKTSIQKTTLVASMSLAALCFVSCSATTSNTTTASRPAASGGEDSLSFKTPWIGMSKQQALRMYGEPSSKRTTGKGEVWAYGAQNWLRMIPYYGPFARPETMVLVFNTSGRLKDFEHGQQGDVISGNTPAYGPWGGF